MPPSARDIEDLTRETRALFQALRTYADRLHEEETVTASMRAVLERLDAHAPETVPEIARAKSVTRQHIQQIVDQLLAAGLVETRPNPAHKRSPLIAITPAGAARFARMRRREAAALERLATALDGLDAAAAAATLRRVRDALSSDREAARPAARPGPDAPSPAKETDDDPS